MKYSPYEFNRDDAFAFARFVGIEAKPRGSQLHFRKCPYCGGNTDDKNTFAISLDTGTFNCLRASCGARGNMITLSRDFGFSLGNEADEYYRPKRQFKKFKKPKEPIVPKDPAIAYLTGRGISEQVARRYEITVQTDHENILVFPFYDEAGELPFIKYRKTDFDKTKDKNKEWSEAGGKPILFGMKQCSRESNTLIVCEGQLDSLSVATAGFENAVSVPTGANGFTWVPYCWDFVNGFETVIIFGDHENGRITLLDAFKNRFSSRIRHVREEDYLDCKDANDILRKYGAGQIRKCIENAVDVPVSHVISLADVEDVNPYEIPKLKTGFKALDTLLVGGIPFGGVTAITGRAGHGKSTVASQIIANALESGHRCFAYSGELPNHLFKSWLIYQIAGPSHVFTYRTKWDEDGYGISPQNKRDISEWFRERMFIYDCTALDDEQESLIGVTENMVKRFGVDVILIDNLMTALDLEMLSDPNKYERQSLFVKKLARIAMRHNALILLVAHKRKAIGSDNANDEIFGSSDITNLANVILSYEKSEKALETQRVMKVTKNRLFGTTETKGWTMSYEPKSKRIYGKDDDVNKEFRWSRLTDDFSKADDEDLPWDE